MSLRLHNTLSGKTEEFKPIKADEARVYTCGPTVYNYAHIGNLRAYVFADTLRRVLEWNGYKVRQIINITDVGHLTNDADSGEDKMQKALRREGKPLTLEAMREVGTFYEQAFLSDLKALNIEEAEKYPRATDHIKEDIEIIRILEEKGIAYKISDGLYFDISKYPEYGKLGGVNKAALEEGSRVEVNPGKKDPRDFNLWKLSTDPNLGFESPWGKGFPGWHIECSAMSRKYLGQPFDIHTGGVDHIGTHHNNEIAQSEAAFGVPLANYWMHNEFLNVASGKMAKSEGNFLSLRTLIEKKYSPLSYRYYLLGGHYRTPMTFSFEALEAAGNTLSRLVSTLASFPSGGRVSAEYGKRFTEAVNDDLNTPAALSVLWEMMRDEKLGEKDRRATALEFDKVLGLDLYGLAETAKAPVEIPPEVKDLISQREAARKAEDWQKADELRKQIAKLGFEVRDTDSGQKVKKI